MNEKGRKVRVPLSLAAVSVIDRLCALYDLTVGGVAVGVAGARIPRCVRMY